MTDLFQELGGFLPVPFDGAPEIGDLPAVMHDLGQHAEQPRLTGPRGPSSDDLGLEVG